MNQPAPRKVLVVDDNRLYREAIRRNLEFVDYRVAEAEDLRTALEEMRSFHPQVVITDLDMTHHTEGLDLIREVKARHPMTPVILVSAVGTFEEGATAREMGATAVISKSRIDQELEHLYQCLDQVFDQIRVLTSLKTRLDKISDAGTTDQAVALADEINRVMNSNPFDDLIKSELFDWSTQLRDLELRSRIETEPGGVIGGGAGDVEAEVVADIEKEIGPLDAFDPETQAMLVTAERLSRQIGADNDSGLARNAGFSYSFAVENEVKQRTGKKFGRFLSSPDLKKLLPRLYDIRLDNLSLGFSRHLLLNRAASQELTPDLVKQVLERMARHGEKYKADGLKALGVITYLFGKDHQFKDLKDSVVITNPLGLQGLSPEEATELGVLLVKVQHTRNPYIHPEFSEREKLSEMRRLVIDSLKLVKKIQE